MPPLHLKSRSLAVVAAAFFITSHFIATAHAGDAYKWSVQYLIDNSQSVLGRSQRVSPRNVRGLAISPDGESIYAGFLHSNGGQGEVRKISLAVEDYSRATENILPGPLAKAIACDDKGRVYISDQDGIHVYDGDLEVRLGKILCGVTEGLVAAREGGELVLYASDREAGTLSRWVIEENGDGIGKATLKGFDGSGVFHIPGAQGLRGMKIDAKGNIWVCDLDYGKVFRLRPDGSELTSLDVKSPIDIAFDGERAFVSRWRERAITVVETGSMSIVGSLSVPWEELELSVGGNNHSGGLSGIVTIPGKGFIVANEAGQTANQKSTYGRVDDRSDFVGGKVFRDAFGDDNDPILRATEVTTQP
jgi:hypothetical protein